MKAFMTSAGLALVLVACATPDKHAEQDDATCRSYGAQPGSDIYVACRMKLVNDRPTFAKLLLESGSSMQGGGGGYVPAVPGAAPVPGATRLGGPAMGICMKTGEQMAPGYKVCYYRCGQSPAVLNVGIAELCPISPS